MADMLESGQFSPKDPRGTFWARGTTGVQYSALDVPLPILPAVPVSDSDWTQLLRLNAASGAPRTWHVRVGVRTVQPTPGPWASQGLLCRLRWSIGNNEDTADIDLRSGVACFPVSAESLTIMACAAPDSVPVAPEVVQYVAQAAVVPYPLPADWRAPTRTISASAAVNVIVPVPRHAQQLSVIASGAATVQFRDSGAVNLGDLAFTGSALAVDVPAGARVVVLTSAPPLGGVVSFVFRLGLG